jgi:hypothetical protein
MARARISQYVIEALVPADTPSPTTVTGAGVSQHLVEILVSDDPIARISQYVIEVLMADGDTQSSPAQPTGGGTTGFGYAS